MKMTLFLKSLGFRVAKAITNEFVEPYDDEDAWSEVTAKDYKPILRHNMHSHKHLMMLIYLV